MLLINLDLYLTYKVSTLSNSRSTLVSKSFWCSSKCNSRWWCSKWWWWVVVASWVEASRLTLWWEETTLIQWEELEASVAWTQECKTSNNSNQTNSWQAWLAATTKINSLGEAWVNNSSLNTNRTLSKLQCQLKATVEAWEEAHHLLRLPLTCSIESKWVIDISLKCDW